VDGLDDATILNPRATTAPPSAPLAYDPEEIHREVSELTL